MFYRLPILLFCLFFSFTTLAGGSSCCGYTWKDSNKSGCTSDWGWRGKPTHCSECQCVDPGRHRNNCISDARYCEAFGNPGAR